MSIVYGTRIVKGGLEIHLDAANPKSYSGSGSNWYDLSGNDRHATFQTAIGYSTIGGGAMDFALTNYATIPHDTAISENVFGTSTNFTTSAWFYARTLNNYSCFLQKATGGSWSNTTNGMWTLGGGISPVFGSNVGGNPAGSYINDVTAISTNTWYHAVMVGDGTNIKLYLNGEEVHSYAQSLVTYARTSNNAAITIGTRAVGQLPQFNGYMSCLSAYNRGLTADEVKQNFNAMRGRYGL